MSATRTQVYFSDEQRRRIDAAAAAQGVTLAEIVRRAVDAYLRSEVDASAVLDATFGVDPGATVPSRDEWDRG
jgi:predicted DNA-binding protein